MYRRPSGCTPTSWVEVTDDQQLVGPGPYTFSEDARYITYQSQPGSSNSVMVKQADTCINAPASPACVAGTQVVSVLPDGTPAVNSGLTNVSRNGRFVTFW